jgi:transcriptional repressor of cell division inhibition gene dicB
MTRQEAAKLLKCSLAELAFKLGISTAAVAQWGDENDIPLLREMQVRELAAGRNPIIKSKAKLNVAHTKI